MELKKSLGTNLMVTWITWVANNTEEPSRLVTVVMFPSLEVQNQFMNREITDQDQEDYDSFVEIYNKNTKVVVRKSNCYLN